MLPAPVPLLERTVIVTAPTGNVAIHVPEKDRAAEASFKKCLKTVVGVPFTSTQKSILVLIALEKQLPLTAISTVLGTSKLSDNVNVSNVVVAVYVKLGLVLLAWPVIGPTYRIKGARNPTTPSLTLVSLSDAGGITVA